MVSGAPIYSSDKPVTPYGDFCPLYSHYGMHGVKQKDAGMSLRDYYQKKGLTVEVINGEGRFIKAIVREGDNIVDVIIFDRRTGRIRSIY